MNDCGAGSLGTNNASTWKVLENGTEVYYVAPTWDVATTYPANRTVIRFGVQAYTPGASYALNDTIDSQGQRFYCILAVAVADAVGTGNAPVLTAMQNTNWRMFSSHYYNRTGANLTGGAPPGGTAIGNNWLPIDVEEIFTNNTSAITNFGIPPADFGSGWTSKPGVSNTSKGSEEFRIKVAGYGYYNNCNSQFVSMCNVYPTQNFIERVDYTDVSPFTFTSIGDVCFDVNTGNAIAPAPSSGGTRIDAGRYSACRMELNIQYLHTTEVNNNSHHASTKIGRLVGTSGTNVIPVNSSGVVVSTGAATTGTVTFPNGAEADASYGVIVTAPLLAGGATTTKVTWSAPTTAGFTYALDVAPGAGTATWVWQLVRYEK